MIYDSFRLTSDIAHHHTKFAGRNASEVWVYRKLMEAQDFLNKEHAAKSVNFPAELQYYDEKGMHTLETIVTISLTDDPWKLGCVERALPEHHIRTAEEYAQEFIDKFGDR